MAERRAVEGRASRVVRVDWVPGAALLAAAVGAGAVLSYTAAAGRPPVYLSLTVCALIVGLAVVTWRRARGPLELGLARPRPASHSASHAPAPPPYDLSRDRSTDAQKYVM